MGMYGGGGSDNSRKLENERQARIATGMQAINSTFDGGTYGYGAATVYEPGRSYYLADGTLYSPPSTTAATGTDGMTRGVAQRYAGTSLAGSSEYSPDAMLKAGKLFTSKGSGTGFGDQFYAERAKAYTDYAMPQLGKQYRNTRNNLTFQLARQGLLNSSAAVDRSANLEQEKGQQQANIANTAQGEANSLRQEVENQRSTLVAQLQASADPTSAAQLAQRAVDTYKAPSSWTPIGNMFGDWTNTYLTNNAAQASGDQYAANWPMVFGGSSSGSGRIVR